MEVVSSSTCKTRCDSLHTLYGICAAVASAVAIQIALLPVLSLRTPFHRLQREFESSCIANRYLTVRDKAGAFPPDHSVRTGMRKRTTRPGLKCLSSEACLADGVVTDDEARNKGPYLVTTRCFLFPDSYHPSYAEWSNGGKAAFGPVTKAGKNRTRNRGSLPNIDSGVFPED